MIDRYTDPKMEAVWSDETRYRTWQQIEVCILRARLTLGAAPLDAIAAAKKVTLDLPRIREIEKRTHHDVEAFVQFMTEEMGEYGKFIHVGMCSSDIVDTAYLISLRSALGLVMGELYKFVDELKRMATLYKISPLIGRTHGRYAEPTTLGLKFLGWYHEIIRGSNRIHRAIIGARVGQFSGSVGTYANTSPEIESLALDILQISPEAVSTQIIPRDRYAEVFTSLAILAGSLERIATDLRLMCVEDVNEAAESFGASQVGSSSMPHKRNPVNLENVCGLSRLVRGCAATALSNMATWGENDISHSSVERVIGPDATALTHTMLKTMRRTITGMKFNTSLMQKKAANIRDYQREALRIARTGIPRKKAFAYSLGTAKKVDLDKSLRHVDFIFNGEQTCK